MSSSPPSCPMLKQTYIFLSSSRIFVRLILLFSKRWDTFFSLAMWPTGRSPPMASAKLSNIVSMSAGTDVSVLGAGNKFS